MKLEQAVIDELEYQTQQRIKELRRMNKPLSEMTDEELEQEKFRRNQLFLDSSNDLGAILNEKAKRRQDSEQSKDGEEMRKELLNDLNDVYCDRRNSEPRSKHYQRLETFLKRVQLP